MRRLSGLMRRLEAVLLAAATLWLVSVTAGSDTMAAALDALREAAPVGLLRWELGDIWVEDDLSAAAVLTISESPLLLSARPAVAELWSTEVSEPPAEETQEAPEPTVTPVTETPLTPEVQPVDNGVTARTLVPTDPSGYTVCGRVYISNSTDYTLDVTKLKEPFDARLTEEEPQVPDAPTDNGVAARTLVPSSPEGYTVSGRAYIANSTDYAITPEEVAQPFAAALGEGSPQILILHTHGSESYTPAPGTEVTYTGDHRTTDARYNVVRMGDVMAEAFGEAGISVLHDRTLYDYPSYSGAYDRSLAAIQSYLAQYPSIRFILDVHRDAIEDAQGNEYKVVSPIEGEGTAAQLTLVMGTDGGGLTHDNWQENPKLAVAVQEDLLTKHPTLMRPLLLRNSRYNQHATTGSLLVEVGAAGNSPEEAALAARLFAESMAEVLQAQSK